MGSEPIQARRDAILIVDDTPENIGLLSGMLRKSGYRVRAAPSGPLALEAARAEAPDLVLLDVCMPQMDGYEVCSEFKRDGALREIPIVFLSALSDTIDKVKAFSAGGVDYVTKPFRVEEVDARIRTHLQIRRLQVELQRSNRELRDSVARREALERVRQTLVQMIVHDLKNPIAAILTNAQVLQQEFQHEAVDDIAGVAELMHRMVLDVLDVSRSEEAALKPRLAAVELRALLEEIVRAFLGRAQRASTALVSAVAPGTPQLVTVDGELLRRTLENLLDNSLKYAPRDSEIRLEAAPDGDDGYTISVCDQGRGIPRVHRERIFEPYARLERDLDLHARASRGLGLAFCRLAIRAHGGLISVEDNAPKGSIFRVRLPVEPPRS